MNLREAWSQTILSQMSDNRLLHGVTYNYLKIGNPESSHSVFVYILHDPYSLKVWWFTSSPRPYTTGCFNTLRTGAFK